MILLRFTVRNHKSIRDETTFELVRPTLRTLQPKDGDWQKASYTLAGVFGGNATGKSALLDALWYALTAIRCSATTWQGSKTMLRAPFGLDKTSRTSTSLYELDVVHDGRRYLYGFEVDQDGIVREWLRDIPTSRWRTLLDRDRAGGRMHVHPSLGGKVEVTPRELVLSRALLLPQSSLHGFAGDLVGQFDMVSVKDSHREARLAGIADSLAYGDIAFSDLEALLQVADVGVTKVAIEENNIPDRVRRALARFAHDLREPESGSEDEAVSQDEDLIEDDFDNDVLEQVVRELRFTHRGVGEQLPLFSIHEESDGTVAWLALAVPALERLRQGGLLLVDEIDASLHPILLEVLLASFCDPSINQKHAQLVFTGHESYVLSPLSDVRLEPEQIWLTDKTYEGVTELTCLADFPKHPDANVAKRYLTGRYGGIPRLSPSMFAGLVQAGEGER